MKILESDSFVSQLKKLSKAKYQPIYGTIKNEITDFFKICNTLEFVWQQNEFLDGNSDIRLSKIRLANRMSISGKSGGYRIIVICDKKKDTVALLYIFPKTGPERLDNIGSGFRKNLVKEYSEQLKLNNLTLSQFNDVIKSIQK